MNKEIKNLSVSIQHKLRNIAKAKGEDSEIILYQYVVERFLYRLSISQYRDKFFLKGAFLFKIWEEEAHRTTRDIDFLGNVTNQIEGLEQIFIDICSIQCEEDCLIFDTESIKGEFIREGKSYGGIRFKQYVTLGKAKIALKVDVGFGDIITPEAEEKSFPSLLGMENPVIKAYPIYTVIAEKLEAMVSLDMDNSRMKDFYDLWFLLRNFEIDSTQLKEAIKNTFYRRRTEIPIETPTAFTEEFALNDQKNIQWKSFLRKNELDVADLELKEVISVLYRELAPLLADLSKSNKDILLFSVN